MRKNAKQELTIFIIIVAVAAFFRLWQANYISTAAVLGIMTVAGIYLLTKELFDWKIAALSGYMTAVSFWHVSVSRFNSQEVVLPFLLVFGFYFLWRGLKRLKKFDFLAAGIFGGLIFYTNILYFSILAVPVLVFLNYWKYLKSDFAHSEYDHAKLKLLQGFTLTAITTIAAALPAGQYYWSHPEFLFRHSLDFSILNIVNTLAMFNFSEAPVLHWTLGVFFVIGLLKELTHWFRKKHGHLSPLHTLLMSWFFIALIPGFISPRAPDVMLTIGVLPITMLLSARGFWWFFDKLSDWYKAHDPHSMQERHVAVALVMIIFLATIGFTEYVRYFGF